MRFHGHALRLVSWPMLVGIYVYGLALSNENVLKDGDTYWHIAAGHWILEHRVVPARPWLKNPVQCAPEIIFVLSGFHCLPSILDEVPFRTTKQWRGFSVPHSGEDVSLAKSVDVG